MKRTAGGQVNRYIGEGRYDEALKHCIRYWNMKDPTIRAETLLAAAYVAQNAHWETVAIRLLREPRDYSDIPPQTQERLAQDMSPKEVDSPFTSWRLHAIAGEVLCNRSLSLDAMRQAVALHPSPETYLPLVRYLANIPKATKADRLEAVAMLRKAVAEFPHDIELKVEFAGALFATGVAKEAEKVADSIAVSEITGAYDNDRRYRQACIVAFLGEIKYAVGKNVDALAVFQEALRIYPSYFKADQDLPLEQWKIYQKLQGKRE